MEATSIKKILFLALLAACAFPAVGTAGALTAGIAFSLLLGNPWPKRSALWSRNLLQMAVVGLGFGLSLEDVWQVGKSSMLYSVIGISLTLLAGLLLGRWFHTAQNTSALISFGTAICGGSAIAALSPVIKARDEEAAVALATVFTLNSVALLLFPLIGHLLHLSQDQFGLWAGLAIHDTSSVVGAAASYGAQALATGTTVKLTRAIWIIPFVLGAGWAFKSEHRARVPLFIVGFVLAAGIRMMLPQWGGLWGGLAAVSRQLLVITLFLVGAGLTRETLGQVGIRPLAQAVTLWVLAGGWTLGAILKGLIG